MFRQIKTTPTSEKTGAAQGKTDLLGSNADECLRLARETRDRAIRNELLRLAHSYRNRARALLMPKAG
ncbi:MAG TPA: hypothetical protein VKZ79_22055 [Alphaproteobacteria bacterium]|nr:hypothetical protein [Alphaproteobacteria bacterium]